MNHKDELVIWLEGELEERGWSIRELGRQAGLSHVTIANILNGSRNPGERFCRAIAHALRVPIEEVFRRAGLLPPEPPETALTREALHLMTSLPAEDQERALAILRALVERERVKQTA